MDVKYVADLARVKLTPKQIKKFETQLNHILSLFKDLEELNTEDIKPCSHVLELKNVFREDIIKASLGNDEVLENAPLKEGASFKVPKVIKE